MQLIYYNAIIDSLFLIESDDSGSTSMFCSMHNRGGWVLVGEL